jgi:FixJ family two-component response regulator
MTERHFPEVATMISIVDDDPLVRDAAVDLLSSLGYPSLAFETAEEFLNSGQIETTLCLITDQHLPGLDGLGLQNKLAADGSHIPVIFITAFPDAHIRERAMKAGATAFLAKPFEEGDLVRALQTALVWQ